MLSLCLTATKEPEEREEANSAQASQSVRGNLKKAKNEAKGCRQIHFWL
jgi:hypothetical protein